MSYENLRQLLQNSSSSRRYFLSLPVELQMTLHKQGAYIHRADDLRRYAAAAADYRHHVQLSGALGAEDLRR